MRSTSESKKEAANAASIEVKVDYNVTEPFNFKCHAETNISYNTAGVLIIATLL